uniref:Nudix hydrolase domain-containing protein n=1 Tax=viral metagenome TaxID=1070528 RepID=A0A6C0BDR4_9ZZZZ
MKKHIRVTKNLDNDISKVITAGGLILYKKDKSGNLKLLLIKKKGMYEDIGGKIDLGDKTIYDTVAREVEEETNNVISSNSIIERIKKAQYFYSGHSKYVIFVVKANSNERHLRKEDFGETELHDDIERTIKWTSLIKFMKNKMNWRMRNKQLFDKLYELEKNEN